MKKENIEQNLSKINKSSVSYWQDSRKLFSFVFFQILYLKLDYLD